MIKFLDKATIIAFHNDQIEKYGGSKGVRDENLLESALAQPEATFDGEYVHEDIYMMAAAYGFHICSNHPFYDGNKRTALIAMYTFLYVNGFQVNADNKSLYAIMMDLASGKVEKSELAAFLRDNVTERQ